LRRPRFSNQHEQSRQHRLGIAVLSVCSTSAIIVGAAPSPSSPSSTLLHAPQAPLAIFEFIPQNQVGGNPAGQIGLLMRAYCARLGMAVNSILAHDLAAIELTARLRAIVSQ
jgi:hypothetical protein